MKKPKRKHADKNLAPSSILGARVTIFRASELSVEQLGQLADWLDKQRSDLLRNCDKYASRMTSRFWWDPPVETQGGQKP